MAGDHEDLQGTAHHEPVLLNEVLTYLVPSEGASGKVFIDCTLGDGGHTIELLKRNGSVIGIDISEVSAQKALERIEKAHLQENFTFAKGNFRDIHEIARDMGIEKVDGILFDLGYSSSQLREDGIGLSFMKEQPLDMRLDTNLGVTAADLVNSLSAKQLQQLFSEIGEERYSKTFAEAIVKARDMKKIQTTKDLVEILVSVAPPGYEHGRIHPATRVFMALRIVVNDEIDNLKQALPRAAHLLRLPGGRMCVISFHSLEDRVTKQFGRSVRPQEDLANLGLRELTAKPVTPTAEEIRRNVRSRSAVMRVFERVS